MRLLYPAEIMATHSGRALAANGTQAGDQRAYREDHLKRPPDITRRLGSTKIFAGGRSPWPRSLREAKPMPAWKDHGSQTLIVWSTLPVATTFTNFSGSVFPDPDAPFVFAASAGAWGPHAMQFTKCPCASTVFTQRPVLISHTRIVLSSHAESRNFPHGWNTRARTQLSCPCC